MVVRFTPQGPGHRLGHLQIGHTAEGVVTTIGLVGNGYAPVLSFIPSTIMTVPGTASAGKGTIGGAESLAIDGGDVLYFADPGNVQIKRIDSSGAITIPSGILVSTPWSVAVDSFGYMYVANQPISPYYFSFVTPNGGQNWYGPTYAPGNCTPSTPCAFTTVGMSQPANMSIDPFDNLFFEEQTKGAAEMPVANVSGGGSLNLWYLTDAYSYLSGIASFAVDRNDNLYTAWGCRILRETLYNAENSPRYQRVAGDAICGFSGDGGQATGAEISNPIGQIAFDAAGDMYFADAGNQRIRRVDYNTGIIRTIAGTGVAGYSGDGSWATHATLDNPTGLAVDSQGQVYVISEDAVTSTVQVIRKITTLGRQAFPSTALGKTAAAVQVVVTNTGNSQLTLAGTAWSGANPGDFKIDPVSTTCVLTTGSVLASGQTCNIGFLFAPTVVGSRAATFNLQSNTFAGVNQILLSGSAVAAAVVKFATPTANAALAANTSVSVKVGVTSSYAIAPTGTVTFKVDGAQVGSPVAVVSGAASITLNGLAVGSHTLSATYSGDKHTASARVSESVSVQ